MKRNVRLPDKGEGWWIEPLIKYGFLAMGLIGLPLALYVLVHFIVKFW